MKKVVSVMLALVMVFALGVVSFATNADATFNIPVYYNYPTENAGTVKPAETFTITISDCINHAENAPTFVSKSAVLNFAESSTQEDVKFAEFTVSGASLKKAGVYTYNITETHEHDYAGLTYDSKTAVLTVYVLAGEKPGEFTVKTIVTYDEGKVNGGKKDEETQEYEKTEDTSESGATFTNIYKAAVVDPSGDNKGLSIQKTVSGNMGDKSADFKVVVSFESVKVLASPIKYTDGTAKTVTLTKAEGESAYKATAEITVKHGETVSFDNVPYGVTYSVVENDYSADGYETAYDLNGNAAGSDGIIGKAVAAPSISVGITNTNGIDEPDTGVILDFLPYVLILVVVAAAAAFIILKKRKAEEY
ncbi:MAG: hypothetical protein KBT46_00070 [Ruminococcus sp.]|nr:hypothetical protein [Candidatus Copronaster equi]